MRFSSFILGSASPRRKQLLEAIVPSFQVVVKPVDEIVPPNVTATDAAHYLASLKAAAYDDEVSKGVTVLTADTVVIVDNIILGKPASRDEAIQMIASLSGKVHEVRTGVCLRNHKKEVTFDEVTKVHFAPLTATEIAHYVDHYQPFDKAGAYGIQEWIGMIGIEKIQGCYYNVMGLPVHRIYRQLKEF